MNRLLLCFALTLATGAAPALELPPLPASVNWVLHLDAQQVMGGELGAWVTTTTAEPRLAAILQVVDAVSGFDPRRDLETVTIAGQGRDESLAIAVLSGRFDAERLTVLLRTNPSYSSESHGARTIHRWEDREDGKAHWACLLDATHVAIAQSEASLKALLACADGAGATLDTGSRFGALNADGQTCFLGLATDIRTTLQDLPPNAAILRQIDGLSVSLAQSGSLLLLRASTRLADDQTASHVENLLRGLLSLAALSPEISQRPLVSEALASAVIDRQGLQITLRCSLPLAELLDQLDQRLQRAKAE